MKMKEEATTICTVLRLVLFDTFEEFFCFFLYAMNVNSLICTSFTFLSLSKPSEGFLVAKHTML